jgi:hypothetical protein
MFWLHRPIEFFSDERGQKSWNSKYAGKEALTTITPQGYALGDVLGVKVSAHRVIIAMTTGHWPKREIDHIDGNRSNNRLANLREVTPQQNTRNSARRKDNKTGAVGVYWFRRTRRWCASITVAGKQRHLGYFGSFTEAAAARKAAERKVGFHPNHGRSS